MEALGTDKVDAYPLPPKYKAILRAPRCSIVLPLSLGMIYGGLFWSDANFATVETAFAKNPAGLADVVCQSVRELYCLTYPTLALKERFLAEEGFKISHHYYPDHVRDPVSQLVTRLRESHQKMQQDIGKVPGGERNFVLVWMSPLSIPMMAASISVPCRTFTEPEQRAFDNFYNTGLEWHFETANNDRLTFLLNMRNEQDANATNCPVQHPMYAQFEMAHYFLTRYCNVFGPRVAYKQYQPLPHRALRIPGLTASQLIMGGFGQSYPELASALAPDCKTVETIAAELATQATAAIATT